MTGRRPDDDRGAVIVWAALSLTMLLGMGALVIDAGALYVERRELQNGADAAALAVATDCAENDCLDEGATARSYADGNASDGDANVDQTCGNGRNLAVCAGPPALEAGALGWVRVRTSTDNPDNPGPDTQVDFVLAPFLDAAHVGQTVRATAEAAWGPVASARTIPLILSVCAFDNGRALNRGGSLPSGSQTIPFRGTQEAGGCRGWPPPPSTAVPGGFGWLRDAPGCQIDVNVLDTPRVRSGAGAPPGCSLAGWLNTDVLVPLFDRISGGGNGRYRVAGFAGFRITGYRNIPGTANRGGVDPQSCRTGDPPFEPDHPCIRGRFTYFATGTDAFGDVDDFGARAVTMVG